MITLEVLAAAHGDALVLTYDGADGHPHRVLVDGGPYNTYEKGLRPSLVDLDEKDRRFDLLIVSHVDADHIDGVLKLLVDKDVPGVQFADVWFNGWPQLSEASDERGALQGEYLSALLAEQPRWNATFGGGPVLRDLDDPIELDGGAMVTVLSPRVAEARRMRDAWQKTIDASSYNFEPGKSTDVKEVLSTRARYIPKPDTGDRDATSFASDTAEANGSSIAVLFEHDGKSILLAADAHERVMTDALRELALRREVDRVPIDVFKLAHHGSAGNISPELLGLVNCKHFVVSTNGAYFEHPDQRTIELLGREVDHPTVHFNYRSKFTERWEDRANLATDGIEAVFPDEATNGYLKITVGGS